MPYYKTSKLALKEHARQILKYFDKNVNPSLSNPKIHA